MYGPPSGGLLLALDGSDRLQAAGCVAVRALPQLGNEVCEMKRLYLRPHSRGLGLGRRLAESVMNEGRRLGYRRMVLDTLEGMARAQALYGSLEFRAVPAYYPNPLEGVSYMAAEL